MILNCYHHDFHPGYLQASPWSGFLPQLIIGIISSVLGFGGAYFLFQRGMKKEKEKLTNIEEKELNDFFSFLLFSCKRICIPALRQIESLKAFLSLLDEKKVLDLYIADVTSFNFKWFEDIDKIRLQKSFLEICPGSIEEKTNLYTDLLTSIDLMDTTKKMLKSDFDFTMVTALKHENGFNHGKVAVFKIYDDIRIKWRAANKTDSSLSAFEKAMLDVAKEWYTIKEPERLDMYVVWDKFLSRKELAEIALNYNQPQILDSLRECSYAFNNYIKNKDIAKFKFGNHLKNIEDSIGKIDNILKKTGK